MVLSAAPGAESLSHKKARKAGGGKMGWGWTGGGGHRHRVRGQVCRARGARVQRLIPGVQSRPWPSLARWEPRLGDGQPRVKLQSCEDGTHRR